MVSTFGFLHDDIFCRNLNLHLLLWLSRFCYRSEWATWSLTAQIAECAVIIWNDNFVDVFSDTGEFLCVGWSCYHFRCHQTSLNLTSLVQCIDRVSHIFEELCELLVIFPSVRIELQGGDVEEFIYDQPVCGRLRWLVFPLSFLL